MLVLDHRCKGISCSLVSFSSVLKSFSIFSPTSPSGSLTSSLMAPSSDMRDKKPSSVISSCVIFSLMIHSIFRIPLTSWYSLRVTWGTSMLWVDGERSSSFLLVKISMATKWTFA
jgi:hypothetical protein